MEEGGRRGELSLGPHSLPRPAGRRFQIHHRGRPGAYRFQGTRCGSPGEEIDRRLAQRLDRMAHGGQRRIQQRRFFF